MSKRSAASPVLEFSKAINLLTTKQDAFSKACDSLKEFTHESLTRIQLEIDAKQKEMEQMKKNVENERKNLQIETDQFVSEYRYEAAKKILKDRKEVPITTENLSSLRAEVDSLRKERSEEIERIVSEERSKAKQGLSAALGQSEMKHKADTAVLQATVDQQKNEIKHLSATIDSLRREVAAQRELTKQVADAGRTGAITQNYGK